MSKKIANQELEAKLAELKKVYQECKDIALKNGLSFLVDLEDVGEEYGYNFHGEFEDSEAEWEVKEIEEDDALSQKQKESKIKKIKDNFKGRIEWQNSTMQCELGGY